MDASPSVFDFCWKAPDFSLPVTDGETVSFADIQGARGTLDIFMCKHCPYERSVLDRTLQSASDLRELGIGVVTISANDADAFPKDGLREMVALARQPDFLMPYLHDETQSVATAYGAVCTPDFIAFDSGRSLQYRGRPDASLKQAGPYDLRRDLYLAMKQVAETGQGPQNQIPSMGCSIKWKEA